MHHRKIKGFYSRICVLILAFIFFFTIQPVAYAHSVNDNVGGLSWELADGTLTISGTGEMADFYEEAMAPWYEYRDEIHSVILPEGLRNIGDFAFYKCENLRTIVIPDSVQTIGQYAFAHCTSLEYVSMGSLVQVIREGAFADCQSLGFVRLPLGIEEIGFRAFYRCESLTSIHIPSSVTNLGMTAFGHCTSLVMANIQARVERVPEWLFYGCHNLTSVTLSDAFKGVDTYAFQECDSLQVIDYDGSTEDAAAIKADIVKDRPEFELNGAVSTTGSSNQASSTTTQSGDEGIYETIIDVTQTDNAAISNVTTNVVGNDGSITTSSKVDASIENQDGWRDLAQQIQDTLDKQAESGSAADKVYVDVFLKDEAELSQDVLEYYAGKNVVVTIHTENGSSWTVDFSGMAAGSISGSVDLSYVCSGASQDQVDALGGANAYQVQFNKDAEINSEVIIQLPIENAKQYAYLYQVIDGEFERLQASVVDNEGRVHLYLASAHTDTEYIIGINVPGESSDDAIVPQNMTKEFDITDTLAPMDYVITGRKSSWGMEIGQVTWIMMGVLGGSVVLIGVVLYLMNKRKLKKGYVVDLDEYELN